MYWFDLNAVYDEGRMVHRVAAFNIIPNSRGPAPAGTNKTLGDEAFKAFDLDEASWREKIRESGFERVEDGVPVPKELHPVWTDFDKALREASEKLEAKACSSELGVMSRAVYDSFVDRSANDLKSNSFGALLKFRFRSGANSLGKRYVNGRRVSPPAMERKRLGTSWKSARLVQRRGRNSETMTRFRIPRGISSQRSCRISSQDLEGRTRLTWPLEQWR